MKPLIARDPLSWDLFHIGDYRLLVQTLLADALLAAQRQWLHKPVRSAYICQLVANLLDHKAGPSTPEEA